MSLYTRVLKPIAFSIPAETTHHLVVGGMLRTVGHLPPVRALLARRMRVRAPELEQTLLGGLRFENPIGLTAGMDKQGVAAPAWDALGFGYMEVGSVTHLPQPGNPGRRMWRMPEDQSIIVNLGLPSQGAARLALRMARLRRRWRGKMVLGISLAKTRVVPSEQAGSDYAASFQLLAPHADFIVLNLSCPNVEGFASLQSCPTARSIIESVAAVNVGALKRPLLVKIGADFSADELDELTDLFLSVPIDGVIATNLRKKTRPNLISRNQVHPGGISGMPLQALADETLARIARRARGRLTLIGVGGVFTPEDAYRKIRLGASLVSLATGFIFNGPTTVRHLNLGLAKLLRRDGFTSVSQAVGVDL